MIQPESTERCEVCGCANGEEVPPTVRCPASFFSYPDETGCYKLGYELKVRALAEAEKERDRLKLIVDNHNVQCVDWVGQRNSAWQRLIEMGKAKKAAEERAAQAERALQAAPHDLLCPAVCIIEGAFPVARGMPPQTVRPRTPHDDSLCDCWKRIALGRAEPRAAAPEAVSETIPEGPLQRGSATISETIHETNSGGGGAQGEEK